MSLPIIIAEWRRNSTETIRLQLAEYNDRPIVDLRCWWRDKAGELRPGKSGLTLSARHLPALADAMAKALVEARRRGLVDDDQSSEVAA